MYYINRIWCIILSCVVNLLIPCFSSESYRCTCLLQWERVTQLFMMQIFQHVTWVILPHTVLGEDYILNWIRLYSTHETLAVTVPCSKNQCLKAGNSICLQVVSMFQQCAFSCSFFFFFFIFIIIFFFKVGFLCYHLMRCEAKGLIILSGRSYL